MLLGKEERLMNRKIGLSPSLLLVVFVCAQASFTGNPSSSLSVHNLNTGLSYATIQEAINAPETLARHVILIDAGVHAESAVVNKSRTIVGQDQNTTVIDSTYHDIGLDIRADDVVISRLRVIGGRYGISGDSRNITISNTIVEHITVDGVVIGGSESVADQNIVTNCGNFGIWIAGGNRSSVTNNKVSSCLHVGISLSDCNRVNVTNNNVTNCEVGILLSPASDNLIVNNRLELNGQDDIQIAGGLNNRIYHNAFAHMPFQGCDNIWDDGYPSGGNYYSDYKDMDLFSGPYQNLIGSDGIWDGRANVTCGDRYPLVDPPGKTSTFNVALQGRNYSIPILLDGTVTGFTYNSSLEMFSFTVSGGTFCNTTIPKALLDRTFIPLVDDQAVPCMSTSNQTHFSVYLNYNFTGTHTVKIIGQYTQRRPLTEFPDLNSDGKIDILDIFIIAKHFGEKQNP
jgi:parallel beta-helix repeat protein